MIDTEINNTINNFINAHIIGSNITATANDYTFMNNLCVGGVVKYTGTFRISHPNPIKTRTHTLSHSFVESPTAGDNIYRYLVLAKDGKGEIKLPDYFKFLNDNIQVFVTPKNGFGVAYGVVNDQLDTISIYANLDMEYNVLVIGTRKDKDAVRSWKGTERIKNEAEIKKYEEKLKAEKNEQ